MKPGFQPWPAARRRIGRRDVPALRLGAIIDEADTQRPIVAPHNQASARHAAILRQGQFELLGHVGRRSQHDARTRFRHVGE